jgi:hypothetical protein
MHAMLDVGCDQTKHNARTFLDEEKEWGNFDLGPTPDY